jgi:hypothetical protein
LPTARAWFRAFWRRTWHYGDVGKRSDSRAGKAQPTPPAGDIALVFGRNQDGLHIIRRRDENAPLEAGLLQPLVEGRPITGELISMKAREDVPFLFDVKSELPAPETKATPGPSQVATDSYRKGWDAIWGGRQRPSSRRSNLN